MRQIQHRIQVISNTAEHIVLHLVRISEHTAEVWRHKATVVGDTVGDPFKDTSGSSLNILIKLMSMVSIVMAELTVAFL